jgi:uncharacterized protein YdaU (DUF1376 family)
MKHYPHHIGDFDKATRHLSRVERSVYRDLIDLYYDTEAQLSLDIAWLCRRIIARTNEESTAVEQVLNEFFTKTPTGWYHERCEEEIAAYRANNSQRAQAGKASAAAKAIKKLQALNGNSTHVEHPSQSVATNDNGASTNQSTNQPINQSTSSTAKPARASRKPTQTPIPDGFGISDRVAAWAIEKGHANLPQHLEAFKAKVAAKGYQYVDWDSAFMEAIREDWAKLRGGQGARASPQLRPPSAAELRTFRSSPHIMDADSLARCRAFSGEAPKPDFIDMEPSNANAIAMD